MLISALHHKSNSISNFFEKKNQIFGSHVVALEDLSVDVSITNVGLILTKPGRFLFSAYGNSGYGQNSISSISNFLKKKKIHIFGFPWCSTREDHSIDVSITNVGLILTKLRWFQLFVKNQNSNFSEKIKFGGFHGVVLVKTFPLMYQFLMLDWYWRSYGDFSSSSKVKIRISNFFIKKFKFWGSHGVVLVKAFLLMYQLLM